MLTLGKITERLAEYNVFVKILLANESTYNYESSNPFHFLHLWIPALIFHIDRICLELHLPSLSTRGAACRLSAVRVDSASCGLCSIPTSVDVCVLNGDSDFSVWWNAFGPDTNLHYWLGIDGTLRYVTT